MSRQQTKTRGLDVCADCGAHDPTWASVNRGILVCDECCSVHRSLGRHISQIKSLRKGVWCPSQLSMVRELQITGANSIWEHSLLDPSGFAATITQAIKISKKKPSAKDPIHPNKADFIRTKHQSLGYINRSSEDSDLSDQLHSSVRTPNLKTSLRLLAAGADPNYVHSEKGNCPIHVAANSGQLLQIELLLVYGADSRMSDIKGKQALDYAKANNFTEISERLNAAQYELTDRLTQFVCGKIAEHETGQHFLVPEVKQLPETLHLSRAAKSGLQALPNRVFEELARDVFDEVDRRETDDVWVSLQPQMSTSAAQQLVPFLPVNALFSSTRNQGRQKLARYTTREFATLIVDIISEARRRQLGMPLVDPSALAKKKVTPVNNSRTIKQVREILMDNDSDSEPLYDEVPSDDDDSDNEDAASLTKQVHFKKMSSNALSKSSSGPKAASSSLTPGEYNLLQGQLFRSDNLIQELVCSNKDMRHEITRLQVMVQKLIDENGQLRSLVIPKSEPVALSRHSRASPPVVLPRQPKPLLLSRPQSMFERGANAFPTKAPPLPPREDSGLGTLPSSHGGGITSISHEAVEYASSPVIFSRSEATSSMLISESPAYDEIGFSHLGSSETPTTMPTKEDVFRKTEKITKCIQELLALAQDSKHEAYLPCAEKIGHAVDSMIQVFPETVQSHGSGSQAENLYGALSYLRASAVRLHNECSQIGGSSRGSSAANTPTRSPYREAGRHVTQQVIQSAFDIAKATKTICSVFQ